jgi:hypothetical protein
MLTIDFYGRRVWNSHAICQTSHDFKIIKELFYYIVVKTTKNSREKIKQLCILINI